MAITINGSGITSSEIADGTITNADINASAAIVGSKLSGAGKVLQMFRTNAPTVYASVSACGDSSTVPTTSNHSSVGFTASITPTSVGNKIIAIYQSQEDAQGTGGFLSHQLFKDGAWTSHGSYKYARYSNQEPYAQTFTYEFTATGTSAISYEVRIGATAAIYATLNRSNLSTGGRSINGTSLILMEVSQ